MYIVVVAREWRDTPFSHDRRTEDRLLQLLSMVDGEGQFATTSLRTATHCSFTVVGANASWMPSQKKSCELMHLYALRRRWEKGQLRRRKRGNLGKRSRQRLRLPKGYSARAGCP